MNDIMNDKELVSMAEYAMMNAYAPYSCFKVGAAVLTENGDVFVGCNIENSAYGSTICAERCAICDAVKNGQRVIEKIAVVGGLDGVITDYCPPCGECRQVMSEFMRGDSEIILWNGKDTKKLRFEELLPMRFKL